MQSEVMAYICPLEQVPNKVAIWRKANKSVVLTTGVYDLYHEGHIRYLETAALYGDVLVVALDCDERVRRFKDSRKPVMLEPGRLLTVASHRSVDCVFPFMTFVDAFMAVRPNVWVHSTVSDIEDMDRRLSLAAEHGTRVVQLAPQAETHATDIIVKILSRFG